MRLRKFFDRTAEKALVGGLVGLSVLLMVVFFGVIGGRSLAPLAPYAAVLAVVVAVGFVYLAIRKAHYHLRRRGANK